LSGLVAEMIQATGNIGTQWILDLCNGIVKDGCIPEDWKSGVILPIYEWKGDLFSTFLFACSYQLWPATAAVSIYSLAIVTSFYYIRTAHACIFFFVTAETGFAHFMHNTNCRRIKSLSHVYATSTQQCHICLIRYTALAVLLPPPQKKKFPLP